MHAAASKTIDLTRRFIPEHLTPLFNCSIYAQLTDSQRLRYNQLHGCYLNEQTIFFESAMAQHILRSFVQASLPDALRAGINTFIDEEAGHSRMFRQLNRRCISARYEKSDFFFVRMSPLASLILRAWAGQARAFPFFLWILLIQEERALFYAKEFLTDETVEPEFVAAQRRHLADEVGHVGWDEELLDWAWPRLGRTSRGINARLFQWMMAEYFTTPKRSGLRVLAELVRQFPEFKTCLASFPK